MPLDLNDEKAQHSTHRLMNTHHVRVRHITRECHSRENIFDHNDTSRQVQYYVYRHDIEPIVWLQVSTECKCLNKFVASKYAAQGKC